MILDLLAALTLAALVAVLAWRRPWRRRDDELLVMEAWLETFSPESYLPMLRLVETVDPGYLLANCGPLEAKRYKSLQRQMLREYLRGLARDFNRLHALATENAIRARAEEEDSSLALVEEKMEFIFSMWSIEFRLYVNQFAPCVVNLRPLLANVDQLTVKAREMSRRRLEYRLS